MRETLANLGVVLAGSLAGLFLQKKLPASFQERAIRVVGFFVLAVGWRVFLRYHQSSLVLTALFLGLGIGIWWKMPGRIAQLGNFFSKFIQDKRDPLPAPSPFSDGFVAAALLFCAGTFAVLAGFGQGASHLWSIRLALAFLPAMILAAILGWGVLFSILPVFLVQAFLTLAGGRVESFFTDNTVADLTSVSGILIALYGLRISKMTALDPADGLPSLLVSLLVSWIYYSLL